MRTVVVFRAMLRALRANLDLGKGAVVHVQAAPPRCFGGGVVSAVNPKRMRVVPAVEPEPMTFDEVQESGNKLAKELRPALIRATQTGMVERTFKDRWNVQDVRNIRHQARLAVSQWQEVDAIATEILDQVDRAKRGAQ